MKLKNTSCKVAETLALSALLSQTTPVVTLVVANDIFIGTRGPTEWQLDIRAGYSRKTDAYGNTITIVTQNDVLKYWNTMTKKDGNELGVWGFANIPAYAYIDNGKSHNSGFKDFTFGAGSRGTIQIGKESSLHGLTYLGAVLPTGEMETGKLSLSGDRTDIFAGGFFTYFPDVKRKFEADLTVQYTFAGRNSKGVEGQNTLSGGLILGGRVFENKKLEIRLAGGINGAFKNENGDHVTDLRGVIRFTPKFTSGKKPIHGEALAEYTIAKKNMPEETLFLLQLRYNF